LAWLFCSDPADPTPERLCRTALEALETGTGKYVRRVQFNGGTKETASTFEGNDRSTLWTRNASTALRAFIEQCGRAVPDVEEDVWVAARLAAHAAAELSATIAANEEDEKRDWRKVLSGMLGDRYTTRAIDDREAQYQGVKAAALVRIRERQNRELERLLNLAG
jgi:hypothetical protein